MDRRTGFDRVQRQLDGSLEQFGPAILRFAAGLLWLSNVSWKVPPDFGRSGDSCRGLCRFVEAGADYPVLPGSAWFFREIVSPNLGAFGWFTLVSEAALAAMLLSGRYLRVAGMLGLLQSIGILVAVANAEHEWYWSYLLMALLHLAILVTVRSRPGPAVRTVGWWVVAYGVVAAIDNVRRGLTGSGSGDRLLFGGGNDLPGDFGRNVFPGSILLGVLFVLLGLALANADRFPDRVRNVQIGWGLVVVAAVLLVTYDSSGTILGLGSRATTAAVLAAAGLALAVPADAGARGDPS